MKATVETKRLKVVMIAKWYPDRKDPQLGVFVRKHAQSIAAFCGVTVFHARSDESLPAGRIQSAAQFHEGVDEHLYNYGPYGGLLRPLNGLLYYSCWRRFRKEVRLSENKPDLLHSYILLRTGLLALRESRRMDIPYVISEQWSGYGTGLFEKKSSVWKSLWRIITRRASGLSAVSFFLKEKIERLSGRKDIAVFYNVIDPVRVQKTEIRTSSPFILVVADLVDSIKNISGILKAYAVVRPDMKLRIIGGGKDRELLETRMHDYGLTDNDVIFEGMQPNEVVYERMRQCAFLIMNSRFETFSSVCAEALVCGKPVIATRCGGPQEFIKSDHGILITPDDETELVEALRKMTAVYKQYDGALLNAYAMERFGKNSVGTSITSWYERCLQDC